MIHAYDKIYLAGARRALGNLMNYGCLTLGIPAAEFFRIFAFSRIGQAFASGEPNVIGGTSGTELAYELVTECGLRDDLPKPTHAGEAGPVYWSGWAVAYYQWERCIGFDEIARTVPMDEVVELYAPYHEMDIRHFVEHIDRVRTERAAGTRLAAYRKALMLTQRELAEQSGVPVRTVQQYEQRQKDINKAGAETVLALASVLNCPPANLTEI